MTVQGYADKLVEIVARSKLAAQECPVAETINKVINSDGFVQLQTEGQSCFAFQAPEVDELTDDMITVLLARRREKVNEYEDVRLATEEEIARATTSSPELPVIETNHRGRWLIYAF